MYIYVIHIDNLHIHMFSHGFESQRHFTVVHTDEPTVHKSILFTGRIQFTGQSRQ